MEKVNPSKCVNCIDFPCLDVNKDCYLVPNIEVDPTKIKTLMVSEAPPKIRMTISMPKVILFTFRQLLKLSKMQDSKLQL